MDRKKPKSKKEKEQDLIERLLGTNDCGEDGIGIMIIGTTFCVGERKDLANDINNN